MTVVNGTGLSKRDEAVLMAVCDSPGIGISDTSRVTGICRRSVQEAVKYLVRFNLVKKGFRFSDARKTLLFPAVAK